MRNAYGAAPAFGSALRYAQCWEDADVLLDALDIAPGDTCLSIASAGDNTLSMLSRRPARVVAVDVNPAQLAALELRVSAYRELCHGELLELVGSRQSTRRADLYARCRPALSTPARVFWDGQPGAIAAGIGRAGKFERYLRLFRDWVLPLAHRRATIRSLFAQRDPAERRRFYDQRWDTRAWRMLFRAFFSKPTMGRLGRDPSLFRFAEDSVAAHLMARVRHGCVELDPSENPYLIWILTGEHDRVLPHALRPENFDAIRDNLDRLTWHCLPLGAVTRDMMGAPVDRANLSDVFEYLAPGDARALFEQVANLAHAGSRLAYWNMIVPRRGAELLPDRLRERHAQSQQLFARDKAFFYRDFVVEEVVHRC